jgi:hypothetical protein
VVADDTLVVEVDGWLEVVGLEAPEQPKAINNITEIASTITGALKYLSIKPSKTDADVSLALQKLNSYKMQGIIIEIL